MEKRKISGESKQGQAKKPVQTHLPSPTAQQGEQVTILGLQRKVGNRAVQRLIAQRRNGDGGFALDDETADLINRQRGGGQPIDSTIQARMAESTGQDLSGVRVHTSHEAAGLSQQLNAQAFTTGQDIFFGEGAYQPGSSAGQELIAHELTHVIQQSTGAVGSGGTGMTVNPPGDAFEQEADAVARTVMSQAPAVQPQPEEEEGEA